MAEPNPAQSLTGRTLRSVAVRIALVVVVATAVSYWHVRSSLERQALDHLRQFVEERRARESSIFALAGEHVALFAEAYRREMRHPPRAPAADDNRDAAFARMFEPRPDGSLRLRASLFDDEGITGIIGKHVSVTDDLKRRLMLGHDLLMRFGPAWRNRFANLYVITPENAALMYWPGVPWALNMSDWEMFGKLSLVTGNNGEVVVSAPVDAATTPQTHWSDLYFDYGVNDWMVSITLPVTDGDRHFLTVGQDVLLRELMQRTVSSNLEGAYNLVFRSDGRLIAHPRFMDAIQATGGALTVEGTGDANLRRIFELAQRQPQDRVIVNNPEDDEVLAVSRLAGPGWFLLTVFPRAIISARAFETARLILLLGALALVLEVAILYWVLRRQVAAPLTELIRATGELAAGRPTRPLQASRGDEIGELARSFTAMANEIDARQTAVNERNAELAALNQQLAHELKERQRAEAEVVRQREALHQSEKLQALGSLLAGVSHELNNPLSVVIGRSHLLEEQLGGTPHAPAVSKVRVAAERCAKIVKTFLAMARQQAPVRQPVALSETLDAALDLIAYRLKSSGIAFSRDIPPDLPPLKADPAQLAQVFGNLLINAQQALEDQAGERWIKVSARMMDGTGEVAVRVADNGPGIPADIQPRIFEPFFTTKPPGSGTGIGLSVCYGIIAAHGGTITVEAPADGGTVFTVTLPAEPTSGGG